MVAAAQSTPAVPPGTSRSSPLVRFEGWMRGAGIAWDTSRLNLLAGAPGCGGAGWGIFAATDIAAGDVLCCIPKCMLLSIRNTRAAELLEAELMRGGLGLTVAVMYERALGTKSIWHGYIESLPKREYVPLFWSDEELQLLQGTELEGRAEEDREVTADDYHEHVAPLAQKYGIAPELWRLEDFQIAASWVASRAFYVDAWHGTACVPLADVFNHKPSVVQLTDEFEVAEMAEENSEEGSSGEEEGENEEWDSSDPSSSGGGDDGGSDDARRGSLQTGPDAEDVGTEGSGGAEETHGARSAEEHPQVSFCRAVAGSIERDGVDLRLQIAICDCERDGQPVLEIVAASNVPRGAEVHNTYGEHGNAELLHKYGFALERNPFNEVSVTSQSVLDAAEHALEVQAREALAQQLGSNLQQAQSRPRKRGAAATAQTDPLEDLPRLGTAAASSIQRDLRSRIRLLCKESSILDAQSTEPLLVMPGGCISKPLALMLFVLTCDRAALEGLSMESLLAAATGQSTVQVQGEGAVDQAAEPFEHAVSLQTILAQTRSPTLVRALACALATRAAKLPGNTATTLKELDVLRRQLARGNTGKNADSGEWAVAHRGSLILRLSEQRILEEAMELLQQRPQQRLGVPF